MHFAWGNSIHRWTSWKTSENYGEPTVHKPMRYQYIPSRTTRTHKKKGPTSATEPTCNYTKSLNCSIIYSWLVEYFVVYQCLSFLSIRTSRLSNFFLRTMQAFYGILTCKVNRACQDCQEKDFCHSSRLRAGCSVGKKSGCLSVTDNIHKYHLIDW